MNLEEQNKMLNKQNNRLRALSCSHYRWWTIWKSKKGIWKDGWKKQCLVVLFFIVFYFGFWGCWDLFWGCCADIYCGKICWDIWIWIILLIIAFICIHHIIQPKKHSLLLHLLRIQRHLHFPLLKIQQFGSLIRPSTRIIKTKNTPLNNLHMLPII